MTVRAKGRSRDPIGRCLSDLILDQLVPERRAASLELDGHPAEWKVSDNQEHVLTKQVSDRYAHQRRTETLRMAPVNLHCSLALKGPKVPHSQWRHRRTDNDKQPLDVSRSASHPFTCS